MLRHLVKAPLCSGEGTQKSSVSNLSSCFFFLIMHRQNSQYFFMQCLLTLFVGSCYIFLCFSTVDMCKICCTLEKMVLKVNVIPTPSTSMPVAQEYYITMSLLFF